jgi:nucleoside-diphosphate-sugar epimerase
VLADARLGDVQRSVLDSSLAARELGWRAQVELADGLARSWTWMREEAP